MSMTTEWDMTRRAFGGLAAASGAALVLPGEPVRAETSSGVSSEIGRLVERLQSAPEGRAMAHGFALSRPIENADGQFVVRLTDADAQRLERQSLRLRDLTDAVLRVPSRSRADVILKYFVMPGPIVPPEEAISRWYKVWSTDWPSIVMSEAASFGIDLHPCWAYTDWEHCAHKINGDRFSPLWREIEPWRPRSSLSPGVIRTLCRLCPTFRRDWEAFPRSHRSQWA
jgi:hypothetical protein